MMRSRRAQVVALFVTIASFASASPTVHAQEQSVGEEQGHGMPIASVRSGYYHYSKPIDPLAGTFEEDLEASMVMTEVNGKVPIPFADRKIVLVPGLFFQHTHFAYRGWDFDVTPVEDQLTDFYATGFELGVINELTPRVWLFSQLSWGFYSDLEAVDENDARFYGLVMADWLIARNLVLGAGLRYDSEFGFPFPIPFLHLAYKTTWFRTELMVPSSAEVFLLPHERVELGARVRLIGNEYRMTYDDESWDNLQVQLSTVEVGGVLGMRVVGGFWVELSGGGNLANRYRAVLLDGSTLRKIDFEPTWFASGAVRYRL